MPCDVANGLFPGRGAPCPRSPSPRPRGRGMPWEVANGLLPGRGPPAPGRGAPGRGAEEALPASAGAAAGVSAAGAAGASVCAAGAAGAGASGAAGAAGEGAAGAAGAGAAGAGCCSAAGFCAAGLAAPGLGDDAAGRGAGAPAAGLDSAAAGAAALLSDAGKAPRSFFTTGASMVDEAERTNSPSSCSFATASFEVMPSSLASSCTRTLATFLLSRSAPSQVRTVYLLRASAAGAAGPITEHNKVLIAGYSSGFHQISDPLSGWTVSRPFPVGTSSRALNQRSTSVIPTEPLKARGNAERFTANRRHAGSGCIQAPRPDTRRSGSTWTALAPSMLTRASRSRTAWSSFFLHPMHVRWGTCFPVAAPEAAAGVRDAEEGDPAIYILAPFLSGTASGSGTVP